MIVLISPRPVENIDSFIILQIESLRELLARRDMTVSVEVRPSCYAQDAVAALGRLVTEVGAAVWLLWHSTRSMQEWFLEQKLPHIVLGTAFHADKSLSVDLDNFATARHAAHTLRRLGHRRIALIMPRLGLAGDRMAEAGFRTGASTTTGAKSKAAPQNGPLQIDIIHHDGTPDGIHAGIDGLLSLQPRPTGIFCCRGLHTVAVMTYLQSRGLRIPQDIAIISRDEDQVLDFITPSPARYHRSPAKLAKAVFRHILSLLAGRKIVRKAVRIVPDFHPHASLETLPRK